uniref:XPA C-terminal domain-containing protein n=1 Tax=Ciona savignyi TaxID=51511 RepID=H2Z4Z7_CIOSA
AYLTLKTLIAHHQTRINLLIVYQPFLDKELVKDTSNLFDTEVNSFQQNKASEETLEKSPLSKETSSKATAAQLARSERNRQKALLLRQSKLAKQQLNQTSGKTSVGCTRVVDSGAGFLIEENPDVAPKKLKKVIEPPPVIAGDLTICLDCDKPFLDSYLLSTYNHPACDKCRDVEDKHSVITKSEAKDSYLLSEVDLTKREPILKCVVRKNPRHNKWGDMKLFLKLQVEQRALEVWGSEEAIEKEHELRQQKREEAKRKKFDKNMKQLRKEVRSSLYSVKVHGHQHSFGDEKQINEDEWTKTCSSCGHQITFEKM